MNIKIPEGKELCYQCGGEGHTGFEQDSGKPFSCYLCCESGYLPLGAEAEANRINQERQAERDLRAQTYSDYEIEQRAAQEEMDFYNQRQPLRIRIAQRVSRQYRDFIGGLETRGTISLTTYDKLWSAFFKVRAFFISKKSRDEIPF